ncbi:hypothetical protein ACRAWD_30300 [Caulobacter segnis]
MACCHNLKDGRRFNGNDEWGGRAKLLWRPTDTVGHPDHRRLRQAGSVDHLVAVQAEPDRSDGPGSRRVRGQGLTRQRRSLHRRAAVQGSRELRLLGPGRLEPSRAD